MKNDTSNDPLDCLPDPINTIGKDKPHVRLSGHGAELKQRAWGEIKHNNPALAELLREKALQDVVAAFDATIYVEAENVTCLPIERLKKRSETY